MDDSRNVSNNSPPSTPSVGTAKARSWRQRSATKHESNRLSSPSSSDYSTIPDDAHPRVTRDLRRNIVRSSNTFFSWIFSFMSLSKLITLGVQLLRLLLIPIRLLSFRLFPVREFDGINKTAISDKAAQVFTRQMKQMIQSTSGEGSESLCPFVEKGYMATLSDISNMAQQFHSAQSFALNETVDRDDLTSILIPPLLLIYIHSPLHRHATSFLKDLLLHPQTLALLHHHRSQGSLLCWGGSIHTADGASVASSLGASCFPFLAMVRPIIPSSSSTTVVTPSTKLELYFRIQGPALIQSPMPLLHQYMATTLNRYEQKLSQSRMQALARIQERRLRQEQDYEYQRSLEEDMKKAKLKEMEEERVRLELEKARFEEEQRLDLLQKLEAEKVTRLHEAKVLVERSSSMEAKNTTRIRFVLPSGQRLEQKFNVEDTVGTLRAFMLLYLNEKFNDGTLSRPILNFDLCCNYPKKILKDEHSKLQDVDGLCPHAVIMVQDLDV